MHTVAYRLGKSPTFSRLLQWDWLSEHEASASGCVKYSYLYYNEVDSTAISNRNKQVYEQSNTTRLDWLWDVNPATHSKKKTKKNKENRKEFF